jgi:ATP-binding cassette subfamily B protein
VLLVPTDNEEDIARDEQHVRHLPGRELVKRVVPLFRPQAAALAIGLVLLAISVSAELAAPLVLRHLIDVDIAARSRSGILRSVQLFAGLFLLGTAANYLQVSVLTRMGLAIVTELKTTVFHHLMRLSMAYFDRNSPGRLMARVESDTERLQALFSEVAVAVLRTVILFVGALTVMFLSGWQVTLGILCVAMPFAIGAVRYFRWMRGYYRQLRAMAARINGFVAEYVGGIAIVQAFGYESEAERRMASLNDQKLRLERKTAMFENGFWGVLSAFEILAIIMLLYLGTGRLFGVTMTVGTVILFVEYTRRVFMPLAAFSEQLGFIQRAFAAADRVFAVLDTPSLTPDRPDAVASVPGNWREVAFENVSFVYDTGTRALDSVSFSIPRGQTVALVGTSGGGKSTITSLMLRFYEPTSGRITLDGVDIRQYRQRAWRSRLGLVLQDIHLFPGTVADNLRALGDGIADEALERAARTAGAVETIARLPRGYHELLSEGGANLSMGERQLLSFARALVNDPDLLILDEATSSVDPGTERRLQQTMERMRSGRTALIIAHRLATVMTADQILVVQGGHIVERGMHDELYASGGVYRDLFDLQFRQAASA